MQVNTERIFVLPLPYNLYRSVPKPLVVLCTIVGDVLPVEDLSGKIEPRLSFLYISRNSYYSWYIYADSNRSHNTSFHIKVRTRRPLGSVRPFHVNYYLRALQYDDQFVLSSTYLESYNSEFPSSGLRICAVSLEVFKVFSTCNKFRSRLSSLEVIAGWACHPKRVYYNRAWNIV